VYLLWVALVKHSDHPAPTPAPPGDSLLRVRDRLVAWTLRHRLAAHPAITALADLHDRRIADDDPSDAEWRAARDALDRARDSGGDLDLDLARAVAIDRAVDSGGDLAFAIDGAIDRAVAIDLARAAAIDLARDSGGDLDRDLVAMLGDRLAPVEGDGALVRADGLALDLVAMLGDRLVPVPSLDRCILGAIEAPGAGLDMGAWHSCATTHCRAGWAITLHPLGAELESVFGARMAGAVIYLRSTGEVPDFYAGDADALASIRAGAEIGGAR